MVQVILTDIEGTTSSISFVHEVLFPYAAKHMESFVKEHADAPEVREQLAAVAAETGCSPDDIDGLCEQLLAWIREDRKITPLKVLQGMIWKFGYAAGDFKGHVYQDAYEVLKQWHERGLKLHVYSSGSVAAQQQIFGHTEYGDLTPWFSGYFDTRIGGKREADSYRNILEQLQVPAETVLFLSDVPAELDAAAQAGMKVCQLVRDDSIETQDRYPAVASFHEVSLA